MAIVMIVGMAGTVTSSSLNWASTISIVGQERNDQFGRSVAISADGTILATGAPYHDGAATDAGRVRVYNCTNSNMCLQLGQDIDGQAENSNLGGGGRSLALSSTGTVLAVAEVGVTETVRIFQWNEVSDRWDQMGQTLNAEANDNDFGWSVSLSSSGRVLAIGAPLNNSTQNRAGHVRMFEYDVTENWTQMGADIEGNAVDSGYFGESVSLSANGGIIAIGAIGDNTNGNNAGLVRVMNWNGVSWSQMGADILGDENDKSGMSVSISSSGFVLAIGAPENSGVNELKRGRVRILEWNSSQWIPRGGDIEGANAGDFLGYSVSLSSDGSSLAIGATQDGATRDGCAPGYVRILNWDGMDWNQTGSTIWGVSSTEYFGHAVELSSDGTTVVLGDPYYDDTRSTNKGRVMLYAYDLTSQLPSLPCTGDDDDDTTTLVVAIVMPIVIALCCLVCWCCPYCQPKGGPRWFQRR